MMEILVMYINLMSDFELLNDNKKISDSKGRILEPLQLVVNRSIFLFLDLIVGQKI